MGVRLTDVPLKTRRAHGRAFVDRAIADGDLESAVDFQKAIEMPSARTYWISQEAFRRVMKK